MTMDQIRVTLPDGKVHEVAKGTTAGEIARKIGPRLAEAALVARVTPATAPATGAAKALAATGTDEPEAGDLVDLRRPL